MLTAFCCTAGAALVAGNLWIGTYYLNHGRLPYESDINTSKRIDYSNKLMDDKKYELRGNVQSKLMDLLENH